MGVLLAFFPLLLFLFLFLFFFFLSYLTIYVDLGREVVYYRSHTYLEYMYNLVGEGGGGDG